MRFISFLFVVLFAAPAIAQFRLNATVPERCDEYKIVPIVLYDPPEYVIVEVRRTMFDYAGVEELSPVLDDKGKMKARRWGFTGPPATYLVDMIGYGKGGLDRVKMPCTIGEVVPPDPDPDPEPEPEPTPDPDNPFPVGKLHALVIYESRDLLDKEKVSSIYSLTARQYVQNNGGLFLQLDDDITDKQFAVAGTPEPWVGAYHKALKDRQGTVPWILVSGNGKFTSRPLPATETELLELLKEHGG